MNLQSFNIATLYCLTNESIRLFYVNKISTTTLMPHRVNVLLGSEWPIGILYRPHTCVLAGQQIQDVVLTLVQRRRWWTNVEPTLIQRLLMSAECCCVHASGTD